MPQCGEQAVQLNQSGISVSQAQQPQAQAMGLDATGAPSIERSSDAEKTRPAPSLDPTIRRERNTATIGLARVGLVLALIKGGEVRQVTLKHGGVKVQEIAGEAVVRDVPDDVQG